MTTSTSRPATAPRTASSWPGRKDAKPKCCWRAVERLMRSGERPYRRERSGPKRLCRFVANAPLPEAKAAQRAVAHARVDGLAHRAALERRRGAVVLVARPQQRVG